MGLYSLFSFLLWELKIKYLLDLWWNLIVIEVEWKIIMYVFCWEVIKIVFKFDFSGKFKLFILFFVDMFLYVILYFFMVK